MKSTAWGTQSIIKRSGRRRKRRKGEGLSRDTKFLVEAKPVGEGAMNKEALGHTEQASPQRPLMQSQRGILEKTRSVPMQGCSFWMQKSKSAISGGWCNAGFWAGPALCVSTHWVPVTSLGGQPWVLQSHDLAFTPNEWISKYPSTTHLPFY